MTTQPSLELFAFWRTSATYRVRVGLNLKGLTAHEHIIDLDAGEQRSPAFLQINPLGAIPALRVPGHPPLTQSLAILEFLDELEPSPPLLPGDLYGRARVRSLESELADASGRVIELQQATERSVDRQQERANRTASFVRVEPTAVESTVEPTAVDPDRRDIAPRDQVVERAVGTVPHLAGVGVDQRGLHRTVANFPCT